jgi:hypothetical protein
VQRTHCDLAGHERDMCKRDIYAPDSQPERNSLNKMEYNPRMPDLALWPPPRF